MCHRQDKQNKWGSWHRLGPSAKEEEVGFETFFGRYFSVLKCHKFLAPQAWESDRRDTCLVIVYPLATALAL